MSAALQQQYEEPLFRNAHEALKFACNFTHGQLKPSVMALLSSKTYRRGKGLGGNDGAAQAGMIKQEIEGLGSPGRALMLARFTNPSVSCSCGVICCSGEKPNKAWVSAISDATDYAVRALGGISNHRLRRALVERYFGRKATFGVIAERMGVNRDTASDQNNKIVALLGREEEKAMNRISTELKALNVTG